MSDDVQVTAAQDAARDQASAAGWPQIVCVLGGIVAIGGGLSLVTLKAASENNLFEAIAHGIGWYCIGKGLFMVAIPFQVKQTLLEILRCPLSGGRV